MQDSATNLVQMQPDGALLAQRLFVWLVENLSQRAAPAPAFTESRARALLRANDLLDDPTRHSFERLMENETAVRLALYDILDGSGLADNAEVQALAAAAAAARNDRETTIAWLALTVAAFAWKNDYLLHQLDPAAPPALHTPAGHALSRAAACIRQQTQRSATERDKLGRKLAFDAGAQAGQARALDDLQAETPIAPLPPHFRPPIPVRYPEVARETLHVDPAAASPDAAPPPGVAPPPGIVRGAPITITAEDLPDAAPPVRQPPLQVTPDSAPPPAAPRQGNVVLPNAAATGANLGEAVRKKFGRGREPLKSTKLRVVVQEFPDGPGLYGLQVKVRCRGINSFVAGTTDRNGRFLCELPVRLHSGLTYDVDVTWPREHDGETERKSITLNADRTEFTLPFYRRLSA